jgi:hypothetical protein
MNKRWLELGVVQHHYQLLEFDDHDSELLLMLCMHDEQQHGLIKTIDR